MKVLELSVITKTKIVVNQICLFKPSLFQLGGALKKPNFMAQKAKMHEVKQKLKVRWRIGMTIKPALFGELMVSFSP